MADLTSREARLLALCAQGFGDGRLPGPVSKEDLLRVARKLGLIQIDSVNVVVRSHYMPFFSRLGAYEQRMLDDLAYADRRLFEYWGHEASFVPIEDRPLLRHRMADWSPHRRIKQLMSDKHGYVERVLEEVASKGPICASDLDEPGERQGSWWGHGYGKTALEWHFARGDLSISHRANFTRYYDLTARVLGDGPKEGSFPTRAEAQSRLLLLAARALGIGTAHDLADYYRLNLPASRSLLDVLVGQGALESVSVDGWGQPAYVLPGVSIPGDLTPRALLSPFDSLVWSRGRTERLFGFDYRLEIYVPERKRRYGYYVMPFLLNGDLVARVDLKADRKNGALAARGVFMETGRDPEQVSSALADELLLMAGWLGLQRVRVGRRGNLSSDLRKQLKQRVFWARDTKR